MKMRKLAAVLSAAAVAVSSFAVSAFAADTTVADVSGLTLTLSSTAQEVKSGDPAASIAVKENDVVVVTFTNNDGTDAPGIVVNGVTATKEDGSALDETDTTAKATITADATKLEVKNDDTANIVVTGVKVTRAAATESTPAETDAPGDGDGDGDEATAPTVTFPSGEQTLTLNANTWNDGEDHSNYQANVALFSGATVDAVKAMTGTIAIKVNLKDMSVGTGDKLNVMVIVQSTGEGDPATGNIWEQVGSGNFASSTTATISVPASAIVEKMTASVKGTVSLLVAFGTATDDPVFTEAPVIKYTFGDEAAPAPGGDDETTTAAPAPGAPAEPNIRPVAPAASEAPAATEAPEVVTAANGESVEAAKDVVPSGAALEVKEQSKEEAVKAVEAVKATDANKEVVETIKKAVEDDKAAVVDIDLVKDGAKVQPNGSIKVTINIPEALKDAAKLFVYRVEADGTFTDVQATVEGGKIVFTTSHFSTYIITSEALSGDAVVTEAAATTAPETTPEKPDDKNQATGVILAVIPAMIAAAGVVVSKKRK